MFKLRRTRKGTKEVVRRPQGLGLLAPPMNPQTSAAGNKSASKVGASSSPKGPQFLLLRRPLRLGILAPLRARRYLVLLRSAQ